MTENQRPAEIVIGRLTAYSALTVAALVLFDPHVSPRTPIRLGGAHENFDAHHIVLGMPRRKGSPGRHLDWSRRSPFEAVLADHAPADARQHLAPLTRYLTTSAECMPDAARQRLDAGGIDVFLEGLIRMRRVPSDVVPIVTDMLEGQLEEAAADFPTSPVIVQHDDSRIPDRPGLRAVVVSGAFGLAVRRAPAETLRMDDPRIRDVIHAHGDALDEWEAGRDGADYGRSQAARAEPSRVRPAKLARVVARLLEDGR